MREVKVNKWQIVGHIIWSLIGIIFLPITMTEYILKSIVSNMFWLDN